MEVDEIVAAVRDGNFPHGIWSALVAHWRNAVATLRLSWVSTARNWLLPPTAAGSAASIRRAMTWSRLMARNCKSRRTQPATGSASYVSFAYDVVTVEINPATATVVSTRRYRATDLYAEFSAKWKDKYRHVNSSFASWGGQPEDRFDRGWSIGSAVPFTDVTHLFRSLKSVPQRPEPRESV